MIQSIMKKAAIAAAGLMIAPAVWAAQYRVTVDADLLNDVTDSVLGITDASTPVQFNFTIDTSLGAVQIIPSGTVLNEIQSTLPVDGVLVPKSAISNLTVTVGTGSWSQSDIQEQSFANIASNFGVFLVGSLSDGATPQVLLNLINSSGLMYFGGYSCIINSPCAFRNTGVADGGNEDFGSLVNIRSTVVLLQKGVVEQIVDVIQVVDTYANIDKGTKNSLSASLGGAMDALDPSVGISIPSALGKIDAFINKVNAQSGKKLTVSQVEELLSAANKIKNRILNM